jgi:hypothetical protein
LCGVTVGEGEGEGWAKGMGPGALGYVGKGIPCGEGDYLTIWDPQAVHWKPGNPSCPQQIHHPTLRKDSAK